MPYPLDAELSVEARLIVRGALLASNTPLAGCGASAGRERSARDRGRSHGPLEANASRG